MVNCPNSCCCENYISRTPNSIGGTSDENRSVNKMLHRSPNKTENYRGDFSNLSQDSNKAHYPPHYMVNSSDL